MRDKGTGISMGFGFVNFETNEAAVSAMNAMNGVQLPQGKLMKISLARPAWKANIHSNVYVSGLPLSFDEEDILDVFKAFADKIENVRKLRDGRGVFRGISVIRFDSEEVALEATRKLNGLQFADWPTPMQIRPWRPEFRPERIDSSISSPSISTPPSSMSPSTPPYTGCGMTTPSPTGLNKLLVPSVDIDKLNESNISTNSSNGKHAVPHVSNGQKVENWQEIWYRYVESQMKQFCPPPTPSNSVVPYPPAGLSLNRTRSTPPVVSETVPSLFVFHLPAETTEAQLQALFEPYGSIGSVRVLAGKGYGFVNFQKLESALAAVSGMNGYKVGNKHLKVEFKKPTTAGTPMASSTPLAAVGGLVAAAAVSPTCH